MLLGEFFDNLLSTVPSPCWEFVYSVEHAIELPIDLLIFKDTRLTSDSWYGRCFCCRLLRLSDRHRYWIYRNAIEENNGVFPDSLLDDLCKYVRHHNKIVKKAMTCNDWSRMITRSPRQFDLDKYSSGLGRAKLIPNPKIIKPTKDRLMRWFYYD